MRRVDQPEGSNILAAFSSAGTFVCWPLVFTASRGSVALLSWSASFFTLAYVATVVMPPTLPAGYIFPASPRLVILKGLAIFASISCVVGMNFLVYAMVGHDIERGPWQDRKNQRFVATFTAIMSIIVTFCGLLLRSSPSHASPLQDEEKTEMRNDDPISRTLEAKPVISTTPEPPPTARVVPGRRVSMQAQQLLLFCRSTNSTSHSQPVYEV